MEGLVPRAPGAIVHSGGVADIIADRRSRRRLSTRLEEWHREGDRGSREQQGDAEIDQPALDLGSVHRRDGHENRTEQAATLPCAAVTAWHAALVKGRLLPGQTVIPRHRRRIGVHRPLALMTGAQVIATTGSDEKIERLRELGVSEVVNYRTTPDWDVRVRELTGRARGRPRGRGRRPWIAREIHRRHSLWRSRQRGRQPRR